jgi:hypothetical protein
MDSSTALSHFGYDTTPISALKKSLTLHAQKLLRGCKEHFRAGVTRISRINAVVPPEKSEVFVQRALALVSASSHDEFVERAQLIVQDYPRTLSWLAWWLRPAHASMLFESQRIMDIEDLGINTRDQQC